MVIAATLVLQPGMVGCDSLSSIPQFVFLWAFLPCITLYNSVVPNQLFNHRLRLWSVLHTDPPNTVDTLATRHQATKAQFPKVGPDVVLATQDTHLKQQEKSKSPHNIITTTEMSWPFNSRQQKKRTKKTMSCVVLMPHYHPSSLPLVHS